MNKNLIKERFKRQLIEYEKNAKVQNEMAEKLISYLPDYNYQSILEIGCGTGLLTKKLNKFLNYKNYEAVDIVSECKDYISKINPNIHFYCSDIEEFILSDTHTYDLIISNATLQWIENIQEFIDKTYNKLNDGGYLLFTTFGNENFKEIYYTLGKTLKYYSKKELETILEKYSPIIEEQIKIITFKSPKDVLKHIQKTGVNAISNESWTKKNLINFEHTYYNLCAENITLTYNPMYVLIHKCS